MSILRLLNFKPMYIWDWGELWHNWTDLMSCYQITNQSRCCSHCKTIHAHSYDKWFTKWSDFSLSHQSMGKFLLALAALNLSEWNTLKTTANYWWLMPFNLASNREILCRNKVVYNPTGSCYYKLQVANQVAMNCGGCVCVKSMLNEGISVFL